MVLKIMENSNIDVNLAEFVATVAFKCGAELSRLMPLLKENLPPDEYDEFSAVIFGVTREISEKIVLKIFGEFPSVDEKLKAMVEKYGRLP